MLDHRVQLITLAGALDLANERQLRAALAEAVGDRSRELVVDLRGVTFVESSVLAVLVHAHQQLERQARRMACVTRRGPVERLLDATGLRDALLICGTPEEGAALVLGARRP
jgi:anti-sigma B factor antagonist